MYAIGAPFLFGGAVMIIALLLSFFIDRKEAEQAMEENQTQESGVLSSWHALSLYACRHTCIPQSKALWHCNLTWSKASRDPQCNSTSNLGKEFSISLRESDVTRVCLLITQWRLISNYLCIV